MRTADTSVVHFDLHAYGLRFAYDLNGRRTRLAFPAWLMPAGRDSVRVAYDAVTGAPARLTDWYGQAYEFHYDLVGRLDTLRLPGGITERRSYFADGALRTRLEGSATRRLHEDALTYDARGKVLNAVALLPDTEITDQFPSRYDGFGALVYAKTFAEAPVVEEFALDAMGNVASKVRSGGGTGAEGSAFRYEAGTGRLTLSTSESAVQGFTDSTTREWDRAGQLTWERKERQVAAEVATKTLRDSSRSWYGSEGKLMAVELVRDTVDQVVPAYREHEEYWYDALGRRVWVRMHRGAGCPLWAKETGCRSSVTRTVWDDAALLAEIRTPATSPEADTGTNSGAHAGRVAYLNGGAIDRPLALLRLAYGTEVILPHRNYRGLVDTGTCLLGAIDCTTIEWPARTYTAYMASPTASDTGPAQWMGSVVTEQKDGSGLLYRRNRYYDPNTGRFTQEDPIGLAGGLNLYGYAGSDPVNFSDPFGLCPQWLTGRPCSGGVDAAAGFVPGISTGIDAATLISGENPLTGEKVGMLGRGVAFAGLALPVSGGQIRLGARFLTNAVARQFGKVVAEGTVDLAPTFARIAGGVKHAHPNDGGVFRNLQGRLPAQADAAYYTEYVIPTPGVSGAGPQRLVVGKNGEAFYTGDHYRTFTRVR